MRKPAEEEYEVEKIVAKRHTKNGLEYLVRWEGYSLLYDTWEPKRSLKNAPKVVSLWQKRKANKTKKSTIVGAIYVMYSQQLLWGILISYCK